MNADNSKERCSQMSMPVSSIVIGRNAVHISALRAAFSPSAVAD